MKIIPRWTAAVPRPTRPLLSALGVAVSTALVAGVGAPSGAALYLVLCALALVVLLRGAVAASRASAGSAPCWWALALGGGLWLTSDVLVLNGVDVVSSDLAEPAVLLFLSSYVALATGLLLLARRASEGRRVAAGIDGAIASTALAVLGLVVVIAPALTAGVAELPTGMAFLVGDLVLVALAVRVLAVQRRARATAVVATAGYLVVLAGDSLWLLDASTAALPLLTAGVLTSALAWAAAASHERARLLAGHPEADAGPEGVDHGPARTRTVAMLLAVCLPSALAAVVIAPWPAGRASTTPPWLVWAVLAAGVVMMALVVARMALSLGAAHRAAVESDRLRRELEHRATHDALTGAADRTHLLHLLTTALGAAAAGGRNVAVLFVDLDRFKSVNDTLGHRAGDDVLRTVAARLRGCLGEHAAAGVVGRLGGDEFALVLDAPGEDGVHELADRVVTEVGRPVPVSGHGDVVLGASVGVAVGGASAVRAEDLLHRADTAAYRAKAAGRGRAVHYDDALHRELAEQTAAVDRLRAAAAAEGGGGLTHLFRQVTEPVSGRLVAVRAVLRWSPPGQPPQALPEDPTRVPDAALARELTRWSLRAAARQQATWASDAGDWAAPVVAVPVSARHLLHPRGALDVLEAASRAGSRTDRLAVVIGEAEVLAEPGVLAVLRRLRAAGVQVCVEDLTWAGLGALRTLPCDVVHLGADGSDELVAFAVRSAHDWGASVLVDATGSAPDVAAAVATGASLPAGTVLLQAHGETGLVPAARIDDALAARRSSSGPSAVR